MLADHLSIEMLYEIILCWYLRFFTYLINAVARDLEHTFLVWFLLQYHPDMNKSPGAEEKFKEISAAYEVSSAPLASAKVLKAIGTAY